MQALDPEAIVLGRFVLLDIAARLERRGQAEDVVLMQLEPLGKFRPSKFVNFTEKLFEHVERMRDGLNNVVCLFAPNHLIHVLQLLPRTMSDRHAMTPLENCFTLDATRKSCQRFSA